MNILISDFLFGDAHKDMDVGFITAVAKFAKTDVISLNGFYDSEKNSFKEKEINIRDIKLQKKTGIIGSRLFYLSLMKETAAIVEKNRYDAVLCLGFETTLFGIGLLHFKNIPLFVFHHKNIDELTNRLKRIAFDIYKNRVYHVVFEEFFKDRLVSEIGVLCDRVYVIPHPAKPINNMSKEKKYDCVGLCNSNDEEFIDEAILHNHEFKRNGLKILLRSKRKESKEDAVEVIKGFMEKERYDEFMAAGRTAFVPLPKTYVYRLSGSIYDALSSGKPVYTTSKYYAEEYERRYPGICQYVGNVDQLINRLLERKNTETNASLQKFLDGHSINTISKKLESMTNAVVKGK